MTALVTGATAGIGFEFADELASRGIDLVLVARDKVRLDTISRELTERYKITIEILPADLAIREQLDLVANRASQQDIELVVNNAGFGLNESFFEDDVESEQYLIDVLVTAVMRITHAAMPGIIARDRGGVINVSSVAGWMTSGTYSATKSWVTTFSESLAMLLRNSKVNVMAVCPGYTRTEFQDRAGMGTESIPDWMWLHAHQVVLDALKDFEKGKCISVPGAQYKVLSLIAQYLPRPLVRKLSVASRT